MNERNEIEAVRQWMTVCFKQEATAAERQWKAEAANLRMGINAEEKRATSESVALAKLSRHFAELAEHHEAALTKIAQARDCEQR